MDFVTPDLGLFKSSYFECVKCLLNIVLYREKQRRDKSCNRKVMENIERYWDVVLCLHLQLSYHSLAVKPEMPPIFISHKCRQ